MPSPADHLLSIIRQAEEKITAGEVARALRLIHDTVDFPDPSQELPQLLSRWNAAERDMLANLMAEDDFRVERAKVTKALVHFLQAAGNVLEKRLIAGDQADMVEDGAFNLPDFGDKIPVLVLYAAADESVWQELQKHLFVALRDPAFHFVDLYESAPNDAKHALVFQQQLLAAAHTVIALVTPNIMTANLFDLAENALAAGKLVPIRVDEVGVQNTPFDSGIKGLPGNGQFISAWPQRNSAWVDVAQNLQAFLEKLKQERN